MMDRGTYESREDYLARSLPWWKKHWRAKVKARRPYYDAFFKRHNIQHYITSDIMIGEVGPGPLGGMLCEYNVSARKLVFIDYIMTELQELQLIKWPQNAEFVNRPAEDTELPDQYVDVLLSYNCLDHGWDIKAALDECFRISRICFLSFECRTAGDRAFDAEHRQQFTVDDVRAYIAESGSEMTLQMTDGHVDVEIARIQK